MKLPENWKHKSGYYLNGDGKHIEYFHESVPLVARIEVTLNEEKNIIKYIISIHDKETKEAKVYPIVLENKENAMKRLKMHMEYYS